MRHHFFLTVCSLVLASSSQASFMPEEGSTCFVSSSHHSVRGPKGTYIYPVVGSTGSVEYYYDPIGGSTESAEYYYDPMIENIKTNPGVKYYKHDERKINLSDINKKDDYRDYNRLFVDSAAALDVIKEEKLFTIRQIDFFPKDLDKKDPNQAFVDFLKNQTLISLSKVTLGNFQVSLKILQALKNLQFGGEAIIRDSQFLDMQCGAATAPIRVSIDKKDLENMKKEDISDVKEALKPHSDYLPTIYMDNPSEERLARLKVYLN